MRLFLDYFGMVWRHGFDLRHTPRALVWIAKIGLTEGWREAEMVQRWMSDEPRTLQHPPLFILGYYRSGTTHLQEVLMKDSRYGYLDFYHCFFSPAFNLTQSWFQPVAQAIATLFGVIHPAHRIPFQFSLPGEEDVSLLFSALPEASNWGQVFPRQFKQLYGDTALFLDKQPPTVRRAFLDALTDLHWRSSKANDHKRMIFKSPPHTGRLEALRELYPDARYIFIRRDPYEVFASNKGLWHSFSLTWFQEIDADAVQENILWSHDLAHQNYERDKVGLAANQLVEVSFEDFLADPMATMEHIYCTLELGEFDVHAPAMRAYVDSVHVSEPPQHEISASEEEAVRTRLGRWLDAWGYSKRLTRGAA